MSAKRCVISSAIGIERALASAQKSPPGAGDHVGQQADVRRRETRIARGVPQRGQVAFAHPGQQQVLIVRDAQLAVAEALGDRGGGVHLLGRRVARRLAGALQRQRHGAVAGEPVAVHVASQPAAVRLRRLDSGVPALTGQRVHAGRQLRSSCATRSSSACGSMCAVPSTSSFEDGRELGVHRIDELLAFGLDEDLDARLVGVVATAVAVVDAHDRLDEDEDLLPRQELADQRCR